MHDTTSRATTAVERTDLAATGAAAALRDSAPVRLLGRLSELADQPQLIAICVAATAFGIAARDARLARTGARMLAAELVATGIKSFVKHRVDRTRPYVPEDGGRYRMEAGDDRDSALNSFPSGHTAGAVAVARAVARGHPRHARAASAIAAIVALVQVPRCRHYPTDLAAGAAIGLVADAAVRAGEAAARRARAALRTRA